MHFKLAKIYYTLYTPFTFLVTSYSTTFFFLSDHIKAFLMNYKYSTATNIFKNK